MACTTKNNAAITSFSVYFLSSFLFHPFVFIVIFHSLLFLLFISLALSYVWAGIAQSVHDSLWAGRFGDRNPEGTRFSAPVQTAPRPNQHPVKWVPGILPGVKRPGRGVNHPLPPSAEVKERVELHLYSFPLWAFMSCSKANLLLFTFLIHVFVSLFASFVLLEPVYMGYDIFSQVQRSHTVYSSDLNFGTVATAVLRDTLHLYT